MWGVDEGNLEVALDELGRGGWWRRESGMRDLRKSKKASDICYC